jgi:hypothetical protein
MPWNTEQRRQLRQVMARLYFAVAEQQRFLADVLALESDLGLDPARIDFSGKADTSWFNILFEADKHKGGVEAIFRTALKEYPRNPGLLALSAALLPDANPRVQPSVAPVHNGLEFRNALRTALIAAFPSWDRLAGMLLHQSGKRLADITNPDGLSIVVGKLLEDARATGYLDKLLTWALNENPGSPDLLQLEQQFSGRAP